MLVIHSAMHKKYITFNGIYILLMTITFSLKLIKVCNENAKKKKTIKKYVIWNTGANAFNIFNNMLLTLTPTLFALDVAHIYVLS